MVNRLLVLFFIIFSVINASNVLINAKVEDSTLKLTFKHPLKKKDIKASAIKGANLTRYFFDFKNVLLDKKVKHRIDLIGTVKSVRIAQNRNSVVRVVIDSLKPYAIKFFQKDKPVFNIVLPDSILKTYTSVKITKKKTKKVKIKQKPVLSAESFNYKDNNSQSVKGVKLINTPYSANLKNKYTIMIDPGHGGHDPGTMWHGYKEKVLVLQIAKRVRKKLLALGFSVKLTRYGDKFIKLSRRTRMANRENADVFVSIHANSIPNKKEIYKAYGIETYFLQTTRNARAKRLAAIENREILKGKDSSTKKVLLNAIFTGPKIELSNRLAIDVQKGMLGNLRAKYKGVRDNGVRGAPFYVLVGAEMPAILIEVGYLSNPRERKRLFSPSYQELLAKGIVQGIVNYLKNREKELE